MASGVLRFDSVVTPAHGSDMIGKSDPAGVFSQQPQVMTDAMVSNGIRAPVQAFFDHPDHGGTLEEFWERYGGLTREQLEAMEEIPTATPV